MSVAATATLRAFGSVAVPALPGAHEHLADQRRLRELPGERVLAPAAADDQDFHCFASVRSVTEVPHAGEDHRHAVLVGGATTSSSRIEPPGCTTARTPCSAAASMPSRNGKNASDASAAPRDVELRFLGLERRDARAHDAARLAGADPERRAVAREHDGIRLHVLHDGPRELQVAQLGRGRRALRDDLGRRDVDAAVVALCTSSPPSMVLSSQLGSRAAEDAVGQPASSTRMRGFFASSARAPLADLGRDDDVGELLVDDRLRRRLDRAAG